MGRINGRAQVNSVDLLQPTGLQDSYGVSESIFASSCSPIGEFEPPTSSLFSTDFLGQERFEIIALHGRERKGKELTRHSFASGYSRQYL